MPEDLFGFTAAQIERIRNVVRQVERENVDPVGGRTQRQLPVFLPYVKVGYLTSAIAGIANLNSNPNVGTLNVYSYSTTGQADTTEDITVYHFATVAATTDRWTMAKFDNGNQKWVIDYQACSTT